MHVYFRYWLKKTQPSISSCSDRITSYSSFAITYISKMNRIKYTNRWLLNSLFFSSLSSRLLTSILNDPVFAQTHCHRSVCVAELRGAPSFHRYFIRRTHVYLFFRCCLLQNFSHILSVLFQNARRETMAYSIHHTHSITPIRCQAHAYKCDRKRQFNRY